MSVLAHATVHATVQPLATVGNPSLRIDDGTWRELRLRLFRFVRSRVRSDQDAEDIVHDALVKGLSKIHTIRTEELLKPWLFQITMNTIRDYYRSVRPTSTLDDEIADEPATQRYLADCVASMVSQLEEPYRSSVYRSEIDEIPMRQIAEELGMSISGVKSRVQRGREKLKVLVTACCQIEIDSAGTSRISDDQPCTSAECTCGNVAT